MKDRTIMPKEATKENNECEEVRESKPLRRTLLDEEFYLDRIKTKEEIIELLKEKIKRLEDNQKKDE